MKYLILLLFTNIAFATEYHHVVKPIYYDVIEQTIKQEVNRGVSLSAAMGGHVFYKVNNKLKWSVTGVFGEGDTAGSAALGIPDGDNLYSITIGTGEGETRGMIGAHGSF